MPSRYFYSLILKQMFVRFAGQPGAIFGMCEGEVTEAKNGVSDRRIETG